MNEHKRPKNNNLVIGVVLIITGAGIGFFGYLHRPPTSLGDAFSRAGTWVFNPTPFYVVLLIAAMFVAAGLLRLARSSQS